MSKTRIEVLEILQVELDITCNNMRDVITEINEAISVLGPERPSNRIELLSRALKPLSDYYLSITKVYLAIQDSKEPRDHLAIIRDYLEKYLIDATKAYSISCGKSRAAYFLYHISLDV